MGNRDIEAALDYHQRTKHSYWSVRTSRHFLDWENQPIPFKLYPTLEPIPLPRDFAPSDRPALEALAAPPTQPDRERLPDLAALAALLYFSAGITRRIRYPGGEMLFRAASCTGALYHIDLYLVCGDLPGLEAGVYHFGPHDFALRCLRRGDFRGELVAASGGEPAVAAAPAVVVCASTYWRNAWKYQARTYRHCFWDTGTILANLLAVAAARDLPARVVLGFADAMVERLLGLDPRREGAICLVPLGWAPGQAPGPPLPVEPLSLETVPLSRAEVDYPEIREAHAASSLVPEEVPAWRGGMPPAAPSEISGRLLPLEPLPEGELPPDPIEQVILRRGSTRRFARQPIGLGQLSTVLQRASRGVPADFLEPFGATLNDMYLIVNAVEGLPPGAYVYHRERGSLEPLREGEFRERAGFLGLEQELPADASADVFFLADLGPILRRFGNRGYRAVQLEAGVIGGKLYLAAYALGLGATGLTFYDDEVTEFFSPHARGKSAIFVVALGVPARRR